MTISRAFRRTFPAAVLVGLIDRVLPLAVAQQTLYAGFWIGYALLAAFGFFASREGCRYRHVFLYTWAFVGFWFLLGVLNLILGPGEFPADWSPEEDRTAFFGYLLSSALFLPLAFASSALGVAAGRLFSRVRHDPPPAA